MQTLLFSIDDQQFGCELTQVERVVPAAALTPLPHAPSYIMGALNIQGNAIAVVNLRMLLQRRVRDIELSDQYIICHFDAKAFAFWVDDVKGVVEYPSKELLEPQQMLQKLPCVDYVIKKGERFILIYNLQKMLAEELNGCQGTFN